MTRALVTALLGASMPALGQITTLELPVLPDVPGVAVGPVGGIAAHVDDSGWVIVGSASGPPFQGQATGWRWTPDDGLVQGVDSSTYPAPMIPAISADGSTLVVHPSLILGGTMAPLRARGAGPYEVMQTPSDSTANITAVSHDGERAVGLRSRVGTGLKTPCLWTGLTFTDLDLPAGFDRGTALAMDANGEVVAGFMSPVGTTQRHPYLWTEEGGVEVIGVPSGFDEAYATAVSRNGGRVFGRAWNASGSSHFIWTRTSGFQVIPPPPAATLRDIAAVGADGTRFLSEVRGTAGAGSRRALLWDESQGYLVLPVPAGQNLFVLGDLSADGGTAVFALRSNGSGDGTERFPYAWTDAGGTFALAPGRGVAEDVSADGQVVVGAIVDETGPEPQVVPVRWELGLTTLGAQVDVGAVPNSSGVAATISARGRTDASLNAVTLRAGNLPPNAFGFFLISDEFLIAPTTPAGSEGRLALGGDVGRYFQPGQIQQAGPDGSIELAIDTSAIPRSTGTVAAMAGELWHVQAWYRDANPGATSNLTGALSIAFH